MGFTDLIPGLLGRTPKNSRSADTLSNAEVAEMIGTSPEALQAFTAAYRRFEDAAPVSDNLFEVNSRQAARAHRSDDELPHALITDIVAELEDHAALAAEYDDALLTHPVTTEEIERLPEHLQPQLTGSLIRKDIGDDAYPMVLSTLASAQSLSGPQREQRILSAVAMMDTLDLDPVLHRMLSNNPAAMGNWLPQLEKAVAATEFFRIPETTVVEVPLPILQLTRIDYFELTPTTMEIVDEWTRRAFDLDESKSYFIKTGTYSPKFDFRNAHVHDPQEVREIGRYLTYLQFQASQMASPLNMPGPIVGVSTTNEWVVREWIDDESNSPEIYHGMPLRTEFRVFIDCDTDEVLAVAPYWDPEVMLERFEQQTDADDPDMRHDAIVFRAHQDTLMERFHRFRDVVADEVAAILPELGLEGQWSLDIMLNDDAGRQFYAIDMAPAASSALAHHVPKGLLKEATEVDWLPRLD